MEKCLWNSQKIDARPNDTIPNPAETTAPGSAESTASENLIFWVEILPPLERGTHFVKITVFELVG